MSGIISEIMEYCQNDKEVLSEIIDNLVDILESGYGEEEEDFEEEEEEEMEVNND